MPTKSRTEEQPEESGDVQRAVEPTPQATEEGGGSPATREEAEAAAPESNPADEAGADQVQQKFDEANAKGYFGETPDETPNEEYTLKAQGAKNEK